MAVVVWQSVKHMLLMGNSGKLALFEKFHLHGKEESRTEGSNVERGTQNTQTIEQR